MNAQKDRAVASTAAAVIFLSACFFAAGKIRVVVDLSDGGSRTLSAASRAVVSETAEVARLTHFLSPRLASSLPAASGVRDLLASFAAASGGRVEFAVEDPGPDPAFLRSLGVEPTYVEYEEAGRKAAEAAYSAILVEYLDHVAVVPFAAAGGDLELRVALALRRAVRGTAPVVGIMAGGAGKTWPDDFGHLAAALEDGGYGVLSLDGASPVPANLACLFVLGGGVEARAASRAAAYARAGGRILVAVDGVDVGSGGSLEARPAPPSPASELAASLGVKISGELVLDEASLRLPLGAVSLPSGGDASAVPYPHWVALLGSFADRGHPLARRFPGLDLYWPSPLDLSGAEGLRVRPLASSTDRSWRMAWDLVVDPRRAALFQRERPATEGSSVLVAVAEGEPGAPAPARALVIGDADFATDVLELGGSRRNLLFLLAAADWLSGDDALLDLRSRGWRSTKLDKIPDAAGRASAAARSIALNVVVVPCSVALFAFLRLRRRRKKAAAGREADGR